MKVSINLEFNSMEEAQAYLNDRSEGAKVEAPVKGSDNVANAHAGDAWDKMDKKTLQSVCDERGIEYSSRTTKAQLIEWLTYGQVKDISQREGEIEDVAQEVVQEREVVVPTAVATPMNEAPATVSAVSKEDLIAQFTEAYNAGVQNGIAEDALQNNIKTWLANANYAGTRLSLLPDEVLATFVPYFVEQTTNMYQAQTGNSFI